MWYEFLASYNGRAVWMSGPVSNFDVELVTDAAGSMGYGAFFPRAVERGPLAAVLGEGGVP